MSESSPSLVVVMPQEEERATANEMVQYTMQHPAYHSKLLINL